MKKFFSSLAFVAVAAASLVSCSKQALESGTGNAGTINFVAQSPDTKAIFGDKTSGLYPVTWQEGDKVVVAQNLNDGGKKTVTVTPSADGKTANFSAEVVDDGSGSYTFYSLYPAATDKNLANSSYWTFELFSAQTPLAGSPDPGTIVCLGESDTYSTFPAEGTTVSFQYKHMVAFGSISIKNLNAGSAKVKAVNLSTDGVPVVGRARWFFKAYGDNAAGTLTVPQADYNISLNVEELSSLDNIMFAALPTTTFGGSSLKVVVVTDKGSFTKTVTVPAGKEFKAGTVSKFSVDFSGVNIVAPVVYQLVTDASTLAAGDELIIAALEYDRAMSTGQNKNNRSETAAGKSEDGKTISDPSDAIGLFELEAGVATSEEGSWSFVCKNGDDAGKYLRVASGGNYLRSGESHLAKNGTSATSYIISIDSTTGDATIRCTFTFEENGATKVPHIRYNLKSLIFSAYDTGKQYPVCLYRKVK